MNELRELLKAVIIEVMSSDEIKQLIAESLKQAMWDANNPPYPDMDLCLINGAMELTGRARQTIYQHVHNKEIPYHKKGGRLYFLRSELKEWILKPSKCGQ